MQHIEKKWNSYHQENRNLSPVDENIPEIARIFKERGVKTILDLGCGTGRHTVYLTELGFKVYGIDISPEAIKMADSALKEKNLSADLITGSIYGRLPYEDNFFDAVIAVRVIHHEKIENIRKTINEMERILKSGGLVFITVKKRVCVKTVAPFETLAPRTYLTLEGEQKGIIHFLFNKRLLNTEFKNFRRNIGVDEKHGYYNLFGVLKKKA